MRTKFRHCFTVIFCQWFIHVNYVGNVEEWLRLWLDYANECQLPFTLKSLLFERPQSSCISDSKNLTENVISIWWLHYFPLWHQWTTCFAAKSSLACDFCWYTRCFTRPVRKYSKSVRFGDLVGQACWRKRTAVPRL